MKTKFFVFSVVILLVGIGAFWWINSRQSDTPSPIAEEPDDIKGLAMKLLSTMDYPPEKLQQLQQLANDPQVGDKLFQMTREEIRLMPPDELRSMAEAMKMSPDDLLNFGDDAPSLEEIRLMVDSMSDEEFTRRSNETERLVIAAQKTIKEENQKDLENLRDLEIFIKETEEWLANEPQRRAEAEKRRQRTAETMEALKWIQKWKQDRRQDLRRFVDLEDVDGKLEIKEWNPEFLESVDRSPVSLPDTQSPSPPNLQQTGPEHSVVPPSPEGVVEPQQSPVASMESIVNVQTQFQSWREDVDNAYLDVLVSRYMTPQELAQFFPTEADRQNLTKRTERLQQDVVSKVRKLVNEIPNATQAQKSKLARELVNANFDKNFAETVLSELEKDAE